MKFEYKRFQQPDGPDHTRPIIPILIRNPRDTTPLIGYEALVDSGADYCVFSGELAELLGIDITAGERQLASGVVAGESRPVYFHAIEIEVQPFQSGERLLVWAGLMPDLTNSGHGILGCHGFFSGLSFVKFRDFADELELGKVRR